MDDIPIPLPANPQRLMDRLRAFMRAQHLAYRTEKTYCAWILDYIRYHGRQHPESLGPEHIQQWLSHLANHRGVAVNTQKTALNAVVFLYKRFLQKDIGEVAFNQANKGRRLPTVFTHNEAKAVLERMNGTHKLIASLMYGAGLRVMEAVRLRVQDVGFGQSCIIVREAKGEKWRRTLLPSLPPIHRGGQHSNSVGGGHIQQYFQASTSTDLPRPEFLRLSLPLRMS